MNDELPVGTEALDRQLRAEISERLRGVCSEWTEAEFSDLVDKIVHVSAKYIYKSPRTSYSPRRATISLIFQTWSVSPAAIAGVL